MTQLTANEPDVFVVGAGPVGLTLASELARHGVRCRIIDKDSGTKSISKALVLHVRTQEVFAAIGAIDETLAQSKALRQVELHAYSKHIGHWHLDGIDSPYPSPVIIGQNRTYSRTAPTKPWCKCAMAGGSNWIPAGFRRCNCNTA